MPSDSPPPHSRSQADQDQWFGDRGAPQPPPSRRAAGVGDPGADDPGGHGGGGGGGRGGQGGGGAGGDGRRRPFLRRLLITLGVLTLVMVIIGAGVTVWGVRRYNEIAFVDVPGVVPPADDGAANWLLIGTDGREGIDPNSPNAGAFLGEQVVGKRTDTIMVVRVDAEAGTVDLLSVPRDLWVPIDGRDIDGREVNGRINGAYNGNDGPARLVATLGAALDIDINHYAEVNFVGFAEIVNSLEGVPLWFDAPVRDVGSGLDIAVAGCHILDGDQALAFARARTDEVFLDGDWRLEPTGDIGRTARQRYFLAQTIDAATGKIGVTQLGKIDEILKVGGQNLVVEDGAGISDMISVARTFASLDNDRVAGYSLPVEDYRTSGGAQVLKLQEVEAEAILEVFRSGPIPAAPSAELTDDPPSGSLTEPGGPAVAGAEAAADGEPPTSAAEGSPSAADASDGDAPQNETVEPDQVFIGSTLLSAPDGEPGYGRFGYAPTIDPRGTPCA